MSRLGSSHLASDYGGPAKGITSRLSNRNLSPLRQTGHKSSHSMNVTRGGQGGSTERIFMYQNDADRQSVMEKIKLSQQGYQRLMVKQRPGQ